MEKKEGFCRLKKRQIMFLYYRGGIADAYSHLGEFMQLHSVRRHVF
jgi:hypothetical protein